MSKTPVQSTGRLRRVDVDLTLATAIPLLVIGISMAVLAYRLPNRVIERRLKREANLISHRLCGALHEHLWNLDDEAIRDYMQFYPPAETLTSVRILTEFGDIVYEHHFGTAQNTFEQREDIYRENEPIGSVVITLSRAEAVQFRRAVSRMGLLVTAIGVLTMLIALLLAQRQIVNRSVSSLLQGIKGMQWGERNSKLPRAKYEEFDAIHTHINTAAGEIAARTTALKESIRRRERAEDELRDLAGSLEDKVLQRTAELREANVRLQREITERRNAQEKMLIVSDREQRRIGHDLHDSLGQQLTGISFLTKSLQAALAKRAPEEAETASRITGLLGETISQTRRISHNLFPAGAADEGIDQALRHLARDVTEIFGTTCTVDVEGNACCRGDTMLHLYRISQEAIHNARHHGRAKHVRITLTETGGRGRLEIADDGRAIDALDSGGDGIGLRIMQYRAAAIAGTFTISANTLGGTSVVITFPCEGCTPHGKTPA